MMLETGDTVRHRYELDHKLGEGSMGEVWKGHHTSLDMPVAIKFLFHGDHKELPMRFRREAKLMARVRHPNIVQIMDFGLVEDTPYIVMELLSGVDLDDWRVREHDTMQWKHLRRIGKQLSSGLEALHLEGITHRDIKPANLMILNEQLDLKIVDFGIAKPLDPLERLTKTGMLIGTPAYMAPEQLLGNPTGSATDIYAVGLIFYELLTGELPFGEDVVSIMRRLREPIPAPNPRMACPEEFLTLIMSMLATEPRDRPTAHKVYETLEALESLTEESAPQTTSAPPQFSRASTVVKAPTACILSKPRATQRSNERSPKVLTRRSNDRCQGLDAHSSSVLPEPTPHTSAVGGHASDTEQSTLHKGHVIVVVKLSSRLLHDPTERDWLHQLAAHHGIEFTIGSQFWGIIIRADKPPAALVERVRLALYSRYGEQAQIRSKLTAENLANKSFSLHNNSAPLPTALRDMMLELV
jgi:serine/threonine protein kinase